MANHLMPDRLRVGAVNYLNTKPLIEGLTTFAPQIELSLELPSKLADLLAEGELDVALIPVIELFRNERYQIIPNISIASHGPVMSVTIFSRVPWNDIRTLALDEGSRTSATLSKILLNEREAAPMLQCEQLPIDQPAEAVQTDAVLLIGDRAMHACMPGFQFSYDLGREWYNRTSLPMVFAVWAVREGVDLGNAEQAFLQAKQLGLRQSGIIAAREAPKLGIDAGYCRRYFDTIIQYHLGPREAAGLNRYYHMAEAWGLASEGVTLDYYHRPNLVESR